jgi:cytochrome c biogenesis protein CcdA
MFRLVGLVVSIGLADSLNPTTIAPALYLAGGEHARTKVTEFTLAVFAVYFLGGVAIVLGPGQLVLSLIPHPDREDRNVLEIVAGVSMLIAAAALWYNRHRLSERETKPIDPQGRGPAILGATITAVELPTAFPYFAAIVAIIGSGFGVLHQVILLVIFNACFVAPLVGIIVVLEVAGDHATQILGAARDWLQARWPKVLAALALLAGVFLILLGATGLAGPRSRFGHFMRHFPPFRHS